MRYAFLSRFPHKCLPASLIFFTNALLRAGPGISRCWVVHAKKSLELTELSGRGWQIKKLADDFECMKDMHESVHGLDAGVACTIPAEHVLRTMQQVPDPLARLAFGVCGWVGGCVGGWMDVWIYRTRSLAHCWSVVTASDILVPRQYEARVGFTTGGHTSGTPPSPTLR